MSTFVQKYQTDYATSKSLFKDAYNIAKDYARFKLTGLAWEAVLVVIAVIIVIVPQLPQLSDIASVEAFMASAFASGGFVGSSVLSTGKKVKEFLEWNRRLDEEKIKINAFINKLGGNPTSPEQAELSLDLIKRRREKFLEEFVEGKENS
ncbi:MAG: hypothetical protein ACFFC6_07075 [Promethearchaeota archaeon]